MAGLVTVVAFVTERQSMASSLSILSMTLIFIEALSE
jgi:hypothetical protein